MMNKLQEVFEKCQNTASWLGLKVNSVTDKNDFEDTPLHTACSWGELQSATVLLDAGADINAKGDQGATPIFNAIVSGNVELIQLLLKRGASKNHKIFGNTTVQDYARNIGASKKIVELLRSR